MCLLGIDLVFAEAEEGESERGKLASPQLLASNLKDCVHVSRIITFIFWGAMGACQSPSKRLAKTAAAIKDGQTSAATSTSPVAEELPSTTFPVDVQKKQVLFLPTIVRLPSSVAQGDWPALGIQEPTDAPIQCTESWIGNPEVHAPADPVTSVPTPTSTQAAEEHDDDDDWVDADDV